MDSENPISNVAPVPEAREVTVVAPASADTPNDTVSDNTAAAPIESENASKKGKTTSQKGKTVLKEKKEIERKRKATHPPTSEMALAAIKELKKRNGASEEDIHEYIEDHYTVDIKRRRHHLNNFLMTGVEKGILEELGKSGAVVRFKVKEKKIAEKGIAKKGTAKKEKQAIKKETAKKGKQTTKKGTAKKEKQTIKKETAKKEKQTTKKGTAKKEKQTAKKEKLTGEKGIA